MKRLAVAFVLFAIAVTVAVSSGYIFGKNMDYFEKRLEELIVSLQTEDEAELRNRAESICAEWKKASPFLKSVVLHGGIDELGRNILSLEQIAVYGEKEEIESLCIESINLIKNLKACEKLSLENIL